MPCHVMFACIRLLFRLSTITQSSKTASTRACHNICAVPRMYALCQEFSLTHSMHSITTNAAGYKTCSRGHTAYTLPSNAATPKSHAKYVQKSLLPF
jgi:hypothetical protein